AGAEGGGAPLGGVPSAGVAGAVVVAAGHVHSAGAEVVGAAGGAAVVAVGGADDGVHRGPASLCVCTLSIGRRGRPCNPIRQNSGGSLNSTRPSSVRKNRRPRQSRIGMCRGSSPE